MPAVNFSVFIDKVRDGRKRQTIRLARKRPIKVGDKLYLYHGMRTKKCEKLGETVCTESLRLPWFSIKDQVKLAELDGFEYFADYLRWFIGHYNPDNQTSFDIIRWDYPFKSEKEALRI